MNELGVPSGATLLGDLRMISVEWMCDHRQLVILAVFGGALVVGLVGWYCLNRVCSRVQILSQRFWLTIFYGLAFVCSIGISLNALVFYSNGKLMPVKTAACANNREPTMGEVRAYEKAEPSHTLLRHDTRFKSLADIYSVCIVRDMVKYASIGDVVIFFGSLLCSIWLVFMMFVKNL